MLLSLLGLSWPHVSVATLGKPHSATFYLPPSARTIALRIPGDQPGTVRRDNVVLLK